MGDDYQKIDYIIDVQYNPGIKNAKKSSGKSVLNGWHNKPGEGIAIEMKGEFLIVQFDKGSWKQLNLQM